MNRFDARDNENLYEYEKLPCEYCGKYKTYEGHDGCLGELIGITNACCGHGNKNKAYVQFLDGTCIRGNDAITIQNILKRNSQNYQDMNREYQDRLNFLNNNVKFYKEEWNL